MIRSFGGLARWSTLHRQAFLAGLAGEALSICRHYFSFHSSHLADQARLDLDFIRISGWGRAIADVLTIIIDQTQRVHDIDT